MQADDAENVEVEIHFEEGEDEERIANTTRNPAKLLHPENGYSG